MPNRLARETSPYLLQHKDNPVDWYPWGAEAFARAGAEDKPIFLSIGYSACHWCHVMAHESFEDEETAQLLNASFVCIKVDREERPDVDSIYMDAVQAITGSGGWPMSVFLMPDGKPFYGGTYFPKNARYGMPSFSEILTRIVRVYSENRDGLSKDAENLTSAIKRTISLATSLGDLPDDAVLQNAFQTLASRFDAEYGGFGSQPKFPPSLTLALLLRMHARFGWDRAMEMVTQTLDRMAGGGMYDQIGGGFHRYSTDRKWLVPHFEKMLYDNALLIRTYLNAYLVTGKARYREVVEESVAYVKREMTDAEGGFYSSQDADSEGREGKFFVWTDGEVRSILAGHPHVDAVLEYWGVSSGANFEGKNILWVPQDGHEIATRHHMSFETLSQSIHTASESLFNVREKRVRPGRDTKILTAWNGLMIHSLALAGRILKRPEYMAMAVSAADFVMTRLYRDARLLRSYKDDQAKHDAYLEDYAFLSEALIELYQTTFDAKWLLAARGLCEQIVALFWNDESGFFDTAHDHESLITRPQELTDNAIPSGTSSAVAALLRMAILVDRPDWHDHAVQILSSLASAIQGYPDAFAYLACQLDFVLSRPIEVVLSGEPLAEDTQALLNEMRIRYYPNAMLLLVTDDSKKVTDISILQNRPKVNGKATAYICRNAICRLPVTTVADFQSELAFMLGSNG